MLAGGMSRVEPPSPTPALLTRISTSHAKAFLRPPASVTSSFSTRQVDPALGRLAFQGLHLGPDLDCGDGVKPFLGQSHCYFVSESGTRSGDQNLLHGAVLSRPIYGRFSLRR